MRRYRWLIYPLLVAAALVLLIALLVFLGARLNQARSRLPTSVPPRTSPTSLPTAISSTPPPATSTAQPAYLPPEVLAQMETIERQVVSLRGLQATAPIDRVLLSPEDLRQRILDDFLADYSAQEARDDARVLALFGLLPPGFDLWNLYRDLYSEQVSGYYDAETRTMFVVQGERFGGPEQVTYAHEYSHALQDMAFDFEGGLDYSDEACEGDGERCAAIEALTEGDASLLEIQWLRTYGTSQDWDELDAFQDAFESPVFDAAPTFLQQDLLFPYTMGLDFVRLPYIQGGWAAVDTLYADPPMTTEQVLHRKRYPWDVPVKVSLPDPLPAPGPGWRSLDRDTLGEWHARLALLQYLPEEKVLPATEGWGGDEYVALHSELTGQGALVWISVWDTVRDAQEFFLALRDYGDARFGPHDESTTTSARWDAGQPALLLETRNGQVLWVLSPDASTTQALRQAVPFPIPVE